MFEYAIMRSQVSDKRKVIIRDFILTHCKSMVNVILKKVDCCVMPQQPWGWVGLSRFSDPSVQYHHAT